MKNFYQFLVLIGTFCVCYGQLIPVKENFSFQKEFSKMKDENNLRASGLIPVAKTFSNIDPLLFKKSLIPAKRSTFNNNFSKNYYSPNENSFIYYPNKYYNDQKADIFKEKHPDYYQNLENRFNPKENYKNFQFRENDDFFENKFNFKHPFFYNNEIKHYQFDD